MVNFLETLYVLTVLAMIAAIVASLRGRAVGARMFMFLTVASAMLALGLYLYLSP